MSIVVGLIFNGVYKATPVTSLGIVQTCQRLHRQAGHTDGPQQNTHFSMGKYKTWEIN